MADSTLRQLTIRSRLRDSLEKGSEERSESARPAISNSEQAVQPQPDSAQDLLIMPRNSLFSGQSLPHEPVEWSVLSTDSSTVKAVFGNDSFQIDSTFTLAGGGQFTTALTDEAAQLSYARSFEQGHKLNVSADLANPESYAISGLRKIGSGALSTDISSNKLGVGFEQSFKEGKGLVALHAGVARHEGAVSAAPNALMNGAASVPAISGASPGSTNDMPGAGKASPSGTNNTFKATVAFQGKKGGINVDARSSVAGDRLAFRLKHSPGKHGKFTLDADLLDPEKSFKATGNVALGKIKLKALADSDSFDLDLSHPLPNKRGKVRLKADLANPEKTAKLNLQLWEKNRYSLGVQVSSPTNPNATIRFKTSFLEGKLQFDARVDPIREKGTIALEAELGQVKLAFKGSPFKQLGESELITVEAELKHGAVSGSVNLAEKPRIEVSGKFKF